MATRVDAEKPLRGRSKEKNRNPEFHKLIVCIPKKTRRAVAIRTATDGKDLELSVLVTKLLDGWTS